MTTVMDTTVETIGPEASVLELVEEVFLRRGRRALPVSKEGRLLGIATLTDVKGVPRELWGTTRVEEVMTRAPLYAVTPADDLATALRLLAEHNVNQLLVLQDGRLLGFLSRADLIDYLQFREEVSGLRPAAR